MAESRVNLEDVRLIDYLDDRIQTFADLSPDFISDLLATSATNHSLLESQLHDVLAEQKEVGSRVEKAESELKRMIETFEQKQADIDAKVEGMKNNRKVEKVVKGWEPVMDRIGRFEISEQYLYLASEIERLGVQSDPTTNPTTPHSILLQTYTQLYAISDTLQERQKAAEGAAPNLLFRVSALVSHRRDQLRKMLFNEVAASLESIMWPAKKDARFTDEENDKHRNRFVEALDKLVQLQVPELTAHGREKDQSRRIRREWRKQPDILFAIEALVVPLRKQFQYHFNTDRITNRIERPELFLDAVVKMISTHEDFVMEYLQPILWNRLSTVTEGGIGQTACFVNPVAALIAGLVPMVREKLKTVTADVLALVEAGDDYSVQGEVGVGPRQVLTHLVDEVLKFDQSLREDWEYQAGWCDGYDRDDIEREEENGQRSFEWPGLADEILSANDGKVFERWLEAEKEFAMKRYDEILDNPRAGEIDYDGVDKRSTKPTNAAIRVHDLLEAVTKRYKHVHSYLYRQRFLIDIQIEILDRFFSRLHDSLDSFVILTTAIGRRMQGITREEQAELEGVAGLTRLCRVYGSASFLEDVMKDWSDDVFFLDMYLTMQERIARRQRHRVSGSVTWDKEIETRSLISDSGDRLEEDIGETESIFDESTQSYRKLRSKAERIITDTVVAAVKSALTAYAYHKGTRFASLGEVEDAPRGVRVGTGSAADSDLTTPLVPTRSAHLTPVLEVLNSHLSFLGKCLSAPPLDRITRAVIRAVDEMMFSNVLLAKQFSPHGTLVLRQDLEAIVGVLKTVEQSRPRPGQKRDEEWERRGGGNDERSGLDRRVSTSGLGLGLGGRAGLGQEQVGGEEGEDLEVVSSLEQVGKQILWNGKCGEGYRLLTVAPQPASLRGQEGKLGGGTSTENGLVRDSPEVDAWAEDSDYQEENSVEVEDGKHKRIEDKQEQVGGEVGDKDKDEDGRATFDPNVDHQDRPVSLEDLERSLYTENTTAAKVLTRLDIRRLTIYEARVVVKNRVDLVYS